MDVNFLKVYIQEIKRELGETYSNRPILRGFQGVYVLRIFNAKWGFNFKNRVYATLIFPKTGCPWDNCAYSWTVLGYALGDSQWVIWIIMQLLRFSQRLPCFIHCQPSAQTLRSIVLMHWSWDACIHTVSYVFIDMRISRIYIRKYIFLKGAWSIHYLLFKDN